MNGAAAERRAEEFLSQRGLGLLERNFHSRHGELDLVMLDGQILVFVEVRAREAGALVSAIASVSPGKQQRLWAAAQHFISRSHDHAERPMRFDLIAIDGDQINWHQNILQHDA